MKNEHNYKEYLHKINKVALGLNKLNAKLINTDDKIFTPSKKYVTDAGFDCRARIDKPITIQPFKRAKIPLGFGINVPINHTGDLRPRSGLMDGYGIVIGYGTIDTGYTEEVKATVFNLGDEPFTIEPKDRIAQLVVLPTASSSHFQEDTLSIKLVDELITLERGTNGHGSTGIK